MKRRGLVLIDGRRYGRKVAASATLAVALRLSWDDYAGGGAAWVDSKSGYSLAPTASPAATSGRMGSGVGFNGTTQFFQANDTGAGDPARFGNGRNSSLSFVVNPPSVAAGTEELLEKGSLTLDQWEVRVQRQGANIRAYITGGLLSATTLYGELQPGVDNLVVITWDAAAHTLAARVNHGQPSLATNASYSIVESGDPLTVGKSKYGLSSSRIGKLRKWDRVLTETEQLYLTKGLWGRTYAELVAASPTDAAPSSGPTLLFGSAGFSGFCDLIYDPSLSAFLGVYRSAAQHTYDAASSIKVVKCPVASNFTDPASWSVLATLTSPDGARLDVRDPKIVKRPSDGKYLVYGGVVGNGGTLHMGVWQSTDATTWDAGTVLSGITDDDWLWRPDFAPDGKCRAVSYINSAGSGADTLRLYESANGITGWATIVDPLDGPNDADEAAHYYRAADAKMVIVARNEAAGSGYDSRIYGPAPSPYTAFTARDTWPRFPQTGAFHNSVANCPVIRELADGRAVIGMRNKPGATQTMALGWLEPETGSILIFWNWNTSADTGYPGVVIRNGIIYVIFHFNDGVKARVYALTMGVPV